jgi:hypothetical protein
MSTLDFHGHLSLTECLPNVIFSQNNMKNILIFIPENLLSLQTLSLSYVYVKFTSSEAFEVNPHNRIQCVILINRVIQILRVIHIIQITFQFHRSWYREIKHCMVQLEALMLWHVTV